MSEKNIDYLSQNAFSKLANQKKYEIKMGLSNLGNTCFMNSVVQVLLNIPELTLYFLSKQYDKDKKVSGGVADAFRDLLLNIINNSDENVCLKSLENLKDAMGNFDQKFKDGGQHDADEFLTDLFTCISEELSTSSSCDKEYRTLAQEFGQDSDIVAKFKKKEKKFTNEENLFLSRFFNSLTLYQDYCPECNGLLGFVFSKTKIIGLYSDVYCDYKTLYDGIKLLKNIHGPERFCNKCNKQVEVIKKVFFVNAPNYLLIHKGRVKDEKENIHEIGIEHPLEFPADDFCLGDLVINKEEQDAKYDLISVVCYSGNGKSGHYFTYSKKSDGWYYFSDSFVKKMPDDFKINEDKSIKNDFYFLVYKKKDMHDKDLFDGYDINDFVHDEEDLKMIAEQNKIKISDELNIKKGNSETEREKSETKENSDDSLKKTTDEKNISDKRNKIEKPLVNIEPNENPEDGQNKSLEETVGNVDKENINNKRNEIEKPLVNVKPENPKIKQKKEEKPKNVIGNQVKVSKNKSLGKEIFKSFGVWSFSLVTIAGVPVGITTTFIFGVVTAGVGIAALFTFVIIKIILLKKQMKRIKSGNRKNNDERSV